MVYKTDIEIAREADKKPIGQMGAKLGISPERLVPYGHDRVRESAVLIHSVQNKEDGIDGLFQSTRQPKQIRTISLKEQVK